MYLELAKTIVAAVAAIGAVAGGGIALFNYRNSVRWKRAELASSHLKDLATDEELVFACRALDWAGGLLVVPESLRPLLAGASGTGAAGPEVIEHDPRALARAMAVDLTLAEMKGDPRLQVYRTAVDSLLSWLSLARKALDRDLYEPADIEPIAWWLLRLGAAPHLAGFMRAFGYERDVAALRGIFARQIEALRGG